MEMAFGILTDADDAFFLHDSFSALHSSLSQTADNTTARVIDLEIISAGAGDDLIDLTSENFSLASIDMTLNGEAGNDILWAAQGTIHSMVAPVMMSSMDHPVTTH